MIKRLKIVTHKMKTLITLLFLISVIYLVFGSPAPNPKPVPKADPGSFSSEFDFSAEDFYGHREPHYGHAGGYHNPYYNPYGGYPGYGGYGYYG